MFKFRLQRVLELRQQAEQEAAIRLASARSGEEEARQVCTVLQSARDLSIQQSAAAGMSPRAGQIQNLRYLVDRLNEQIDAAHREVESAAEHVRERMEEFSAAFRDRRMLDRLRDKALETHRTDEVQADRKLMDTIALSRFVRSAEATEK